MRIEPAAWDDPDGVALRALQRADIDSRYGADTEPGTKPTADDISLFVLARDAAGVAIGCGALRRLDDTTAEIKRMFVRTENRGVGVSRMILAALEDWAWVEGWTTLRLETGTLQHEAIGLYTSAGYHRIPNFGPYRDEPLSLCFERHLADRSVPSGP